MQKLFLSLIQILFIAGCAVKPLPEVVTGPPPEEIKVQPPEEIKGPPSLEDLTLEEKVGQMFMLRYSGNFYNSSDYTYREVKRLVKERGIGGVIQFFGNIHGTISNVNELQSLAKIPIFVAADYERGVGQQLDTGTLFPSNMALAATGEPELAYQQGKITAREARATGVHITFAPVMDVNSNPDNPIINFRSYSDSPETVSKFGVEFIRGAQENGLITTAKHFPGHGNTGTDSHTSLPVITAGREEFEAIDLVPFRKAVDAGVKMIMTAHIAVPSLDDTRLPATLSPALSHDLLRDKLGYQGLIVTDALEMGGITESFWVGEAAIRAIEAGSDIVLLPMDVDKAMSEVTLAVRKGRISEARINESVSRILAAKEELGLFDNRFVSLSEAKEIIGNNEHLSIASRIASKSITLVKDENNLIPIPVGKSRKMSHILLATSDGMLSYSSTFRSLVSRTHGNVETSFYYQPLTELMVDEIIESAVESDFILVTLLIRVRMNLGTVSIDQSHRRLITKLQDSGLPVVVVSFGSPYVADVDELDTYLCGYSYGSISQYAMADAIFGATSISGKLPVRLSANLPTGYGIMRSKPQILPMTTDTFDFTLARDILDKAISDSVFPGAQVAVIREGKLVWSYQAGGQTYDNNSPAVTAETIYDVASLTKVTSTTPVVMKLVEQRILPLDEPIKDFIPEFSGGDKERITIRLMLTHSAGLQAYDEFPLGSSGEEILTSIIERPLVAVPGEKYIYSDFGPILLGKIIKKVTGRSLDNLAESYIFRPLGMKSTMFNPDPSLLPRIAPTEIDRRYQRGLVRGIVHDERAWQLGGVAGHAGLFSTALDLARYTQMMMDEGFFAGRRYFRRSTIKEFTRRQGIPLDSERTLGWDTPSEEGSLAGDYFSPGSYGHTGFTGTSMWIDPNRKIAVILLTNHVYPSRGETPEKFEKWKTEMWGVRRAFYNEVMKILLSE